MNILLAGKHKKQYSKLAKWLESKGHKIYYSGWSVYMRKLNLLNIGFVFIWNGSKGGQKKMGSRCRVLKIPHAYVEVAWFPQNSNIYIDPTGTNGAAKLHNDSLDWVTAKDYQNMEVLREEYKQGIEATDEGYVLVPLQLPQDISVRAWSPYSQVKDIVRVARETFPDRKIIFRKHPKDRAKYPSLGIDWSEGYAKSKMGMIMAASEVWGMNSTLLVESALVGKKVTCLGKNFLDLGDNREHALAALVALELPFRGKNKNADYGDWMVEGRPYHWLSKHLLVDA